MANVALIGEDLGHAVVVDGVVHAVVEAHAAQSIQPWVTDNLDTTLTWCGARGVPGVGGLRFTNMSAASEAADQLGQTASPGGVKIKTRGHFDGESAKPEAAFWRRVILAALLPGPDALVIVKDTDGEVGALDGLRQARAFVVERNAEQVIIIAGPHPEIEAWLVGGFTPVDDDERARLSAMKKQLSMDPTRKPHCLTAHPNTAPRDAKRVLQRLLHGRDESTVLTVEELLYAVDRCVAEALRTSDTTGIPEFGSQVVEGLYPLLGGRHEP